MNNVQIYWGDAHDNIAQDWYTTCRDSQSFLADNRLARAKSQLSMQRVYYAQQVHGTHVQIIDSPKLHTLFTDPADAIITTMPYYAIGVMTADCVPIVLHDAHLHVLAVIHAGWRGVRSNIIAATVDTMKNRYLVNPAHVVAYVGPHARSCCYEVRSDVAVLFDSVDSAVLRRNGVFFLDLYRVIEHQLILTGILPTMIITDQAQCTMCNLRYCSYRRTRGSGRNMNLALLL